MKHYNRTFQLPSTFQPDRATLVDFIVLPYKTERKSGKYVHLEKTQFNIKEKRFKYAFDGILLYVDKHLDHITN
jgi:hypothetical protein